MVTANCGLLFSFPWALAAPIALLTAFALAYLRFPGQRLLVTLFNTLMAVPAVVVGLVLYMLLSVHGPAGELRLLFTPSAMIIGQFLLCLPLMVGGNILYHTRNITTAIALETSKGAFASGIALGLVRRVSYRWANSNGWP